MEYVQINFAINMDVKKIPEKEDFYSLCSLIQTIPGPTRPPLKQEGSCNLLIILLYGMALPSHLLENKT
jgi:hypothetical protein